MNAYYSFAPSLLRHGVSTSCALFITGFLFLLMYSLISKEVPELRETRTIFISPVMAPREEPEVIKDEAPEKPLEPEMVPEWDVPTLSSDVDSTALISINNALPDAQVDKIDLSGGSSTIVPVYRIAPDYPARALSRGIEGYVDLVFDVTASGRTENIRVLEAQPEGVFEKSAMRTLAKWKYRPPVQDGVPYGQKGMTTRISFRLEQ